MAVIIESGIVTATSADILSGGRIGSANYNGQILIELQADVSTDAIIPTATLQTPDGATPMDAVQLPAGPDGTTGVIKDTEKLAFGYAVQQGGTSLLNIGITGATKVAWRATLTY